MLKDKLWKKIEQKFSSEKLPDLQDSKTLATIQKSVNKTIRPRLEIQRILTVRSTFFY